MNSGICVVAGELDGGPELPRFAGFRLDGKGALCSRASDPACRMVFEGVLTAGRQEGRSDAETALDAYRQRGVAGLEELDGFFRLVVVDSRQRLAWLVSDPLSTRPVYLYQAEGIAAAGPDPLFFRELGLPMHLDRQGLYQTVRYYHPIGRRSLLREVSRAQPRTSYRLHTDGRVEEHTRGKVTKEVDDSLDLDAAASRIKRIVQEVLEGILCHPALTGRAVQLPLTSGMDSRHILGELIEQGHPPELLWHVRIRPADYAPVEAMSRALCIPLEAPPLDALDLGSLLGKWLRRTGGMVNLHQLYLMAVGEKQSGNGVLGFDGYLCDHLLGCNRRPGLPAGRDLAPFAGRVLFSDHGRQAKTCVAEVEELFDRFEGPEDFRVRMFDAYTRGLFYTGGVYPVLGDGFACFAPGAHRKAFEFCRTVPEEVAAFKRARLRMFQRDFPHLARYPTEKSQPLTDIDVLRHGKSNSAAVRAFVKGMLSLHRTDPSPDECHGWLRQVPFLRKLHDRVVRESSLVADRHLPAAAVSMLWKLHQAGAFFGHTMSGLASAEVAYRLLVHRESPGSILGWLTG